MEWATRTCDYLQEMILFLENLTPLQAKWAKIVAIPTGPTIATNNPVYKSDMSCIYKVIYPLNEE